MWQVASKTADVDPDTFEWQPVNPNLADLQPLADILPLETWVELPMWIEDQIVLASADWVNNDHQTEPVRLGIPTRLAPRILICRHLWRYGEATSIDLAQISGTTPVQTRKELQWLVKVGLLTAEGKGSKRRYRITRDDDVTSFYFLVNS